MCGSSGGASFNSRILELGHYGKGPQHKTLGNGPLASERVSMFKFQLYPGLLVDGRDGTILILFCGYKPCLLGVL